MRENLEEDVDSTTSDVKGKRAYAWGSRIEAFPQLDSLLTKFHLPSNHLFFSLSQITFLYNDSIPLCSQQRLI